MSHSHSVVIVIPIYKANISLSEQASLRQVVNVLGKYSITFICPHGLDISAYREVLITCAKPLGDFKFIHFDKNYFASISGYNRLMISWKFYKVFDDYEYMLVYQLDCWVFRDELDYWCSQGYNYIGAPWFDWSNSGSKSIIGVGNGGFSLRDVQVSLRVLQKIEILRKFYKYYLALRLSKLFSYTGLLRLTLLPIILRFNVNKYTFKLATCEIANEDYYWCKWLAEVFPEFRLAPISDAMKFSFECNPSYLFELSGRQLPMGCHAWEKHEPEFWSQFIKPE